MATESSAVVRFIDLVQKEQHSLHDTEIVRQPLEAEVRRAKTRTRTPLVMVAGAALLAGAAVGGGLYVSKRGAASGSSVAAPAPAAAPQVAPIAAGAAPAEVAAGAPAPVPGAAPAPAVAPLPEEQAAGAEAALAAVSPEVLAETGFDIRVTPPAVVVLDGRELGTAPLRVRHVAPGPHVIELMGPDGYFSRRVEVELGAGEAHEIKLGLDRISGGAVAAAGGAEEAAKVEARPERDTRRRTAESGRKAARRDRARRRTAAKPDRDGPVPVPALATTAGETGTLMVGSKPPCDIIIDGKRTGLETPQRSIELSPGTHRVTLVNKELGIQKRFKVKIEPGKRTRAILDLTSKI